MSDDTPARPPGKVRRIDFYPDEFLSGVDGMSPEQIGVYWLVCSKIYSRGEPIPDDDRENARIFRMDLRTWKRLKGELLTKEKLRQKGGCLSNGRCATELAKAHKRIVDAHKNGTEGGRPPGTSAEDRAEDSPTVAPTVPEPSANRSQTVDDKSGHVSNGDNDLAKAEGFGDQKPNHQPPTYQPLKEGRKEEHTPETTEPRSGGGDGVEGDHVDSSISMDASRGSGKQPSAAERDRQLAEMFDTEFWPHYPPKRRSDKDRCRKKFIAAAKAGVNPRQIIAGVLRYAASDEATKEGGHFAVAPFRFLNEEWWERDFTSAGTGTSPAAPGRGGKPSATDALRRMAGENQ